MSVQPKPVQDELEVWLGGTSRAALRRVGRLADGWLPSFCTADDARQGRKLIEETAEANGRAIDPEHFGALIIYTAGEVPERLAMLIAARKPGTPPAEIVAEGTTGARRRLEAFIEAGASKFVLVPAFAPDDWTEELERVASDVLPLQV